MKWILAMMAAGALMISGCQCQKKSEEAAPAMGQEMEIPVDEMQQFENMDQEGVPEDTPEDDSAVEGSAQ